MDVDGQHQYEINLKKDDLFINLSSDDVYFISKQMDKWFRILLDDSYVPVTLPSRPMPIAEPVAQPAPAPAAAAVYAEPAPPPVQAPPPVYPEHQPAPMPSIHQAHQPSPPTYQAQPEAAPAPPAQPEQPVPQAYAEVNLPLTQPQQPAPAAYQAPPAPPQQPVAQPALAYQQPAPTAAPIPQAPLPPVPEHLTSPQPAAPLDPVVKDDFEAVMDSLMKDLEDPPEGGAPVAGATVMQAPAPHLHEDLGVSSLADLCDRSHAGNSEDYLLLSAYYLMHFENQEKFSLKRVNSTLVKSGLTPVNHSVLETTLGRGYLSMVPDLSGMADVSEYVLTSDGQQAVLRLL